MAPAPAWRTAAPWALALVGLGATAWGWLRTSAPAPVIRYGLALPRTQEMILGSATPVLAPDGSFLIYAGPAEGGSQLWLKRRDSYAASPIGGTIGAQAFAVSPDGLWVAFVVNGRLNKIPVGGGAPVLLASENIAGNFGLAWMDDGTIVYPLRGAAGLMSVPAAGGAPSILWQSDTLITLSPAALPDGRGTLFVACEPGCAVSNLWAIRGPGKTARLLVPGASAGAFIAPNLLVYSTDAGGMFALHFDLSSLETSGTPTSLTEQLPLNGGLQLFRVSKTGTLLALTGGTGAGRLFDMVWVDRTGRETPVDTTWTFRLTALANNHGWALSPDESRLAIGLATPSGDDIWVVRSTAGLSPAMDGGQQKHHLRRRAPPGRHLSTARRRLGARLTSRDRHTRRGCALARWSVAAHSAGVGGRCDRRSQHHTIPPRRRHHTDTPAGDGV